MAKEKKIKHDRDTNKAKSVSKSFAKGPKKTTKIVNEDPGRDGGPGIKNKKK